MRGSTHTSPGAQQRPQQPDCAALRLGGVHPPASGGAVRLCWVQAWQAWWYGGWSGTAWPRRRLTVELPLDAVAASIQQHVAGERDWRRMLLMVSEHHVPPGPQGRCWERGDGRPPSRAAAAWCGQRPGGEGLDKQPPAALLLVSPASRNRKTVPWVWARGHTPPDREARGGTTEGVCVCALCSVSLFGLALGVWRLLLLKRREPRGSPK